MPDSVGGIEKVIDEISTSSIKKGHIPIVLALSNQKKYNKIFYNGYEIYHSNRLFKFASTGFSYSVFNKFKELSSKVDIIHYHFPWPLMDLVHLTSGIKKPTLLTYHSDIIRQKNILFFYKPLLFKFLNSVDHIVATSPNYLSSSKILKKFSDKVSVIPIGIDYSLYPIPTINTIEKWSKKFEMPFFLFVGVLRYYKGLHVLLDAIHNTNLNVVIVGSGPTERELLLKAKKLNLNNVHFLGELDEKDKVALFKLCYGVIFPSHIRSEAFGISLLEGAMFGKPMISCEIQTGTSFINLNQETGFVVKPNCKDSLRNAMEFLISNPKVAIRMGENARSHYEREFTSSIMMNKYDELYKKIYQKKSNQKEY
jgi:rhamnosyl/mannosyltransferase